MKKICVIDYWNYAPHLETSFEIIKSHLDKGDLVNYFFIGHDISPREGLVLSLRSRYLSFLLPERRAERIIKHANLFSNFRITLPPLEWRPPGVATLEELALITYKDAPIGLGVLSSLLFRFETEELLLVEHEELVAQYLLDSARLYEYSLNLFSTIKPDTLYLFNGRFFQSRAIQSAASKLGMKVIFHERGCDNNHFYTSSFSPVDVRAFEDEIMEVWSREINRTRPIEVANEWFVSRKNAESKNWITFSKKENIGLLPKLDFSKRIVVFYTSSNDELFAVKDLVNWDRWPSQEVAILDLIRVCSEMEDIQLVVRLHPNIANKQLTDLKKWNQLLADHPQVLVVQPEDKVDSYELLMKAFCVVTCGSTVSIEAIYWGKPSICLGPQKYYRYFGKLRPVDNRELRNLLSTELEKPDSSLALPFGYYLSTYGNSFEHYKSSGGFKGRFMGKNLRVDLKLFPLYEFVEFTFFKIFRLLMIKR